LDGYKRPVVGSLSANLQRFGMDRIAKVETVQEVIDEMTEDDETGENSNPASPGTTAQGEDDG